MKRQRNTNVIRVIENISNFSFVSVVKNLYVFSIKIAPPSYNLPTWPDSFAETVESAESVASANFPVLSISCSTAIVRFAAKLFNITLLLNTVRDISMQLEMDKLVQEQPTWANIN